MRTVLVYLAVYRIQGNIEKAWNVFTVRKISVWCAAVAANPHYDVGSACDDDATTWSSVQHTTPSIAWALQSE